MKVHEIAKEKEEDVADDQEENQEVEEKVDEGWNGYFKESFKWPKGS